MRYLKSYRLFESFSDINPKKWEGKNPTIYTCIIGDHNNLLKQPQIEGVDYVCFTDQDLKGDGWNIIKIPSLSIEDRLYAKHPKMLPKEWMPNVDKSVWIDGSIMVLDPEIFNKAGDWENDGMALFKHPERNCIYDEIKVSSKMPKYKNQNLFLQGQKYKKLGWPKNSGLWACGIIYRDHKNQKVHDLGKDWFKSQEEESIQDQIPFPYLLDKKRIEPGEIPGSIWNNEFFRFIGHKRDK